MPKKFQKQAVEEVSLAKAKFVRVSARKVRYVADLIRGKRVGEARMMLQFIHRPSAAPCVKRVLDSAVANVDRNEHPDPDELKIGEIFVDVGPIMKRFQPRAMGRGCKIRKRSSHLTIRLTR
ncbi:MAG: 50S ribosomal protein L22 [bacterium]